MLLRGHGSQNHHVFEKGCWFPPAKPLNIGIECFIQYYHDSTNSIRKVLLLNDLVWLFLKKVLYCTVLTLVPGKWFGPLVDQKNYGLFNYGFCIIRNFPVMQLKLDMDCGLWKYSIRIDFALNWSVLERGIGIFRCCKSLLVSVKVVCNGIKKTEWYISVSSSPRLRLHV